MENGRHGEGDEVALFQVHGGCGRWVGLMFLMSIGCRKEAKRQTLKNGNSKIEYLYQKVLLISLKNGLFTDKISLQVHRSQNDVPVNRVYSRQIQLNLDRCQ